MPERLSRRDFLRSGGLGIGAAVVSGCASRSGTASSTPAGWAPHPELLETTSALAETAAPRESERTPVLRVAHLTDMHVRRNDVAMEGFARAIRHAQEQSPAADFILNTGDSVMETLFAGKDDALAQWDAFREVLGRESSLPVVHCIGNHDVWGWGLRGSPLEGDPLFGKAMAIEQLGLDSAYFSFDRQGWHFIVLDSTHPPVVDTPDNPYAGKLDEEQFVWLEQDLSRTSSQTPICIASHIPIVAACEYFDGPNEDSGNWVVPSAWMHIDARRFRSLFLQHPNIRLCLSGHTHQHERLEYLGVKYLTNGAVSGNWWSGAYMDFPPAYVLVDLFADGSSEHTFVVYDEG